MPLFFEPAPPRLFLVANVHRVVVTQTQLFVAALPPLFRAPMRVCVILAEQVDLVQK